MPAATRHNLLTFLCGILVVGCGARRATSPSPAVTATTHSVWPPFAPAGVDAHKYDAYGPWQYSIWGPINRDNIYTRPTTGPDDDSVLAPWDDDEW